MGGPAREDGPAQYPQLTVNEKDRSGRRAFDSDRRAAQATGMDKASVRYIVDDVDAAIAFYVGNLGFSVVMHPAPAFAMLDRGAMRLLLSMPNAEGGGGQSMPDGTQPRPGGWNRMSLQVDDLPAMAATLRAAGVRFRNDIVHGVGGDQVLVDDPSGNCVELFQPRQN
jgi:catechol 2,3-dioxygenase-like lactoylglutathione lyase family enzyme